MKIEIKQNGNLSYIEVGGDVTLKEVYNGVGLVSNIGERFSICMRDSGFEFNYNDIWYEAKEGVLKKLGSDVKKYSVKLTGSEPLKTE